jgi:hypothetical protein
MGACCARCVALTRRIATHDVAFPPEKWGELVDKPSTSFVDSERIQSVPPPISRGGVEVTFLHKLVEAFFQPAGIGLEEAPKIIGGHILEEPLPP